MKIKDFCKKYIDKSFFKSSFLIIGAVVILVFSGGFITVYNTVTSTDFADGIYIDGINVSGMTYEGASQRVHANSERILGNKSISLVYSDMTTKLSAEDMGLSLNEKEVIDNAYYYNKNESDSIQQRFDKSAELSRRMYFNTEMSIDEAKLRDTVTEYAEQYYEAATNATVTFNKDTCEFSYTEEKYGAQINVDALVRQIKDMLTKGGYSTIRVSSDLVSPEILQSDLEENNELLAEYETEVSYNENRNINVQLICDIVNGRQIEPGEILSLNELTGERTAEKGYQMAPAIVRGVTEEAIGGGICQLAGTLYNAALLADLEIVERVNHTWPSSYLPIGLDATLNWNDKDLKIRNVSDYTIYFSTKFQDEKVIVKIYGQPLESGVTIKIQNDILEEIAPTKTEYRYTNELATGAHKIIRSARNGYSVKVYRIYFKNGFEIARETISWDVYPALNKIVLVGINTQEK